MKTLELNSYLAGVKTRKAKLAPKGGALEVESCRNGGPRRTAAKGSALKRADTRANAASVQLVPSNY